MNISVEQIKLWIAELYIANKLLEEQVILLIKENQELKTAKGVKEDADN